MVQGSPFVTVVIPTHNRRDLLKAAVESVFLQTYPKDCLELIIVDNDSSDGTGAVVTQLQAAAPCALKYVKKDDEGAGVSRNIGIEMGRGSIVAFMDDDCIADPHWLTRGVSKLTQGVGLVQGRTLPDPRQAVRTFSKTIEVTRENGLYETCNILYRKEALDQVGGFAAEFIGRDRFGKPRMGCEDIDLGWRVKKAGWHSVFADDAIVYHHVFDSNPLKEIFSYRKLYHYLHAIPYVVKKHPELRQTFMYGRIFLTETTALFDLFLVSCILGVVIHPGMLVLSVPFLVNLVMSQFWGRGLRRYHRGIVACAILIVRDFCLFILLMCGSIRCRSVVL